MDAEDIPHALRNAAVIESIAEDPTRYLVLGPGRAAQLLDLVVIDRPHGPAVMRRRGGRSSMGSAASTVESVRLDPELKREPLLHAAKEHISVSEAIRRAIRQYLRAS